METLTTPDNPVAKLEALLRDHPQIAELFALLRGPADPRDSRLVSEICRLYLETAHEEISPHTLETRRHEVKQFVAAFGERTVTSMTPLDLKRWLFAQKSWKSPWKRFQANAGIQRVFNWAVEQRLIAHNTVKGVKLREKKTNGRDMSQPEYQAIMRHSDLFLRRLLVALRLTGARPGELSALRWHHIRWTESLAILPEHKTVKKTGKPRVLYFVPQMLKLLAIMKRDCHGPCAAELRRMLENAPDRRLHAREVAKRLQSLGFSYRAIWRARHKIGATYRRIQTHDGRPFDCMPFKAFILARVADGLTGTAIRSALSTQYGFNGSVWAVRRFVRWLKDHPHAEDDNPAVHELCNGEEYGYYVYELPDNPKTEPPEDDHVFVNQKWRPWTRHALCNSFRKIRRKLCIPEDCKPYSLRHLYVTDSVKRNANMKALATLVGHTSTRMIEAVYCHVDRDWEYMLNAAQHASGLVGAPQALPLPVDAESLERLIQTFPKRTPRPRPPRKVRDYKKLLPAHVTAYELCKLAKSQNPALANATDGTIYRWLKSTEHAAQLPPAEVSFVRYLGTARRHIDGQTKRQQRRQPLVDTRTA